MWCTRTSLMPRTPVTTCQGSTSATDTSWFCTTTQTGYVHLGWGSPLNRAGTKIQPQHQLVKIAAWGFLRNKIQTVRGSEWDTQSEFRIYLVICVQKKVPLDKGCEKHVSGECTLEERVQRAHSCTAAGEIFFMGKKSPVLYVLCVTGSIQGPGTFSKDKNQTMLWVCVGDGAHSDACCTYWEITS